MTISTPPLPQASAPPLSSNGPVRLAILGDYPLDLTRISGGVEAVIVYLVQGLRQYADLDIHVVTLREDVKHLEVRQQEGVTAHYVPAAYRFGNLTFFIRNKLRLRRVLRDLRPDLVHAHIAGTYSEVAFSLGLPAVLTPHGIRHREAALKRSWLSQWVRRPLIQREERVGLQVARHIIAISPYILTEFADVIRGRVYPIENPISNAFFELTRAEQPGRILFAGYLGPRKGALRAVQAMRWVRERCPSAELRLAGAIADPLYFDQIQTVVREHRLADCVRFLGHLDEEALLREYAECSVFVLPSQQETAPMVIQQAMAAGKPVVSTPVGGIPHLVEPNATGYLVGPDDVVALADALARLLADADLRRRLGARARQEAERRFRAAAVARQTHEVYRQIYAAGRT